MTIGFGDFSLTQTILTGRRTTDVTVDAVHDRFKRDPETRKQTTELEGVNVDIVAAKGKIQTVKLPLACKETTDRILEALKLNQIVRVNFGEKASTLRGRCYAMQTSTGQLLQGVSCTATEINITGIEDVLDDLDIDY